MTGTAPRAMIASTSAAAAALIVRDGRGLGDVEHVELVVRDAAPLARRAASRCRCPCRGRAASRRRSRSRRRAAPRPRAPAATCRCRSARRSRSAAVMACQTPAKYPTPNGAPRYSSFRRPRRRTRQPGEHLPRTRPVIDAGSRASAATSPAASASSRRTGPRRRLGRGRRGPRGQSVGAVSDDQNTNRLVGAHRSPAAAPSRAGARPRAVMTARTPALRRSRTAGPRRAPMP